jgi:hypothetical protein
MSDGEQPLWDLAAQVKAMESWLTGPDGQRAASRLIRKYGLPDDPRDIASAALLRIRGLVRRRTGPLPSITSPEEAARYAYRAVSNTAIDLARRSTREKAMLMNVSLLSPAAPSVESEATATIFVEAMFAKVSEIVARNVSCPGCQQQIVLAATTEILHLVLIEGESDGIRGQTWFDDVIYETVDRFTQGMAILPAARRQRKSRCKRCVMELISLGLSEMGYRRG